MKLSVGNVGNAWAFMMIFLFLPNFLINNIFTGHELANTLAYSVITISITAGAITYLFAGYISDKVITRWGKRRPFFLLAIPAGICYLFLGVLSPSTPVMTNFIFVTIIATVYAVLDRVQYCAFWSLYMDLTNPEERITTSVTFNMFGLIGTVGALFVTPILSEPPLSIPFSTVIVIVGVVYIGTILFALFLGPREDIEKLRKMPKTESYFTCLSECLGERNFLKYLFATFFFVLGYSISVLILMPFIELHSIAIIYMLIALLPVALFYFYIFNRLAKTKGRITTFKLTLLIGTLTLPICMFLAAGSIPTHFIQVFLIIVLILQVVIGVLTFQYAVLMDLALEGREAFFAGLFLFVIVIPIPVSSALIGPIRDFLSVNYLIWQGANFSFAIIFAITAGFLLISYLILRTIKIKEEIKA